ncbi:MAG: phage tail sheath subtilisin-like domain-containing protein [Pseudoflavonifractor sp.]|nr:phage tail sheath subtilisin-like domain-containing protein [Pseudoflavonifractor sp.]
MNSLTKHERPGVYSAYEASALVQSRDGGAAVGIAARCGGGTADTLYRLSRYEEAAAAFGAEENMTALIRLLFRNGAAEVYAVPVAAEGGYDAALALLAATEGIGVVTCDSTELTVQEKLRESVKEASAARRERIAVVSAGDQTVAQLAQRAESLNSERMVLVGPAAAEGTGAELAAAVAGAIAGESDPAIPLGGAELSGIGGLSARYGDSEIDTLVRAGVTPVEEMGGIVSVVRGVTTRTKTGEAADVTWRELTTIRIVDDVIPAVRSALRTKFRRAKNTEQSRGAIRSQVVLELENKMSREIITGYDGVRVSADSENPTVCVVEFSFTVAHGLNQIWLSAHITV